MNFVIDFWVTKTFASIWVEDEIRQDAIFETIDKYIKSIESNGG